MAGSQPELRRPVRAYFEGEQREWASLALQAYCTGQDANGASLYSGAWFDRLADRSAADSFTAVDLVAVTMLSVTVPPQATIRILETERATFTKLLQDVGPDRPIWAADADDIGVNSAAQRLWQALHDLDGLGPVIASKLMAVKRPSLIPIYDKHVNAALGWPAGSGWVAMRSSMLDAHEHVLSTIGQAGVEVSALRAVDIVVWMHQHGWQYARGQLEPPPLFG